MPATNYQRLGQYIPRICGLAVGIYLIARNYLKTTENVAIERELRYNQFDPENPVYKIQINHPENSLYNYHIYKTGLQPIVSRTLDCSAALMIFMSKFFIDRNLDNRNHGYVYAGINFATTFSTALYMHFFEQARDAQFITIEKLANDTLNKCNNLDDAAILNAIETAIEHKQQSLWQYCYLEQGASALNLAIGAYSAITDARMEIARSENAHIRTEHATAPTTPSRPLASPVALGSNYNLLRGIPSPTPKTETAPTIYENRAELLAHDLLKVTKPVADLIPTLQRYTGPLALLGRVWFCDTTVEEKESYKQNAEFFAALQAVKSCGSKDLLQRHYKCTNLNDNSIETMLKAIIDGECTKIDIGQEAIYDDEKPEPENEPAPSQNNYEDYEILPSGEIPNSTSIAAL